MSEITPPDSGCEPAVGGTDAHCRARAAAERASRYGTQIAASSACQRRSRLQRQQEASGDALLQREAPQRASLTTSVRKRYLKELLLGGFSSGVLSSGASPQDVSGTNWALDPMEHAWMLSSVEGSFQTILEFVSEDPYLLCRKDFISGYSVLHWLSKRGQDETLVKVLRYAESAGVPVNVNARGSGGLTPLHVASMHGQYMAVKLLVGAFGADVDVMDYNGRRAWQYLQGDAPPEIRELLGALDDAHNCAITQNANVNNNSGGSPNLTAYEADDDTDLVTFDLTVTRGSWGFESFRKVFTSLSFRGHKN